MINIGISGILGKMGRRILSLSLKEPDLRVTLGLEAKGHKDVGNKVEGVLISDNPEDIALCDCLIEFSTPEATIEHIFYLLKYKKKVVIGTTGLSLQQKGIIEEASKEIPIVLSPNMSVGVNVLFKLIDLCGKVLKDYNIYIEEAHHIHKKDAPSGTAKKIAEIVNKYGFNITEDKIKSIREGEIVGDHRIVFESSTDKLELFHSAKTRDIFAQGAIVASKWIVKKERGLYSMEDVLFGRE